MRTSKNTPRRLGRVGEGWGDEVKDCVNQTSLVSLIGLARGLTLFFPIMEGALWCDCYRGGGALAGRTTHSGQSAAQKERKTGF